MCLTPGVSNSVPCYSSEAGHGHLRVVDSRPPALRAGADIHPEKSWQRASFAGCQQTKVNWLKRRT